MSPGREEGRSNFRTSRGLPPRDLDPMAQRDVEQEIIRLSNILVQVTEEVGYAATEEAKADVAFKLANARQLIALRNENATVAIKDALALDACASEFEAMKMGEAVYRALQEKGRNLRAQLDALRTLAANVRSAVTNSRGEGW